MFHVKHTDHKTFDYKAVSLGCINQIMVKVLLEVIVKQMDLERRKNKQ